MQHPVIVGIGEILWDLFPDGARFGGAPSNFACSVSELSPGDAQVFIVSAVGEDELGQRAIAALGERGVNTSCVQIDRHPTGQVLVELDAAGIADYRFAPDSAWDHLSWTEAMQHLAEDCDAVCFGTLGQRSEGSRATIRKFVEATSESTLRVLDVNLRPPFVDDHVIRDSLVLANFLKLNDEELPLLARLCGATGSSLEVMKIIADRYQLDGVALTRGAEGALLISHNRVCELPGIEVQVADTVGAGDAFTASMVLGLLAGKSIEEIGSGAIDTASYVCSQVGATMRFPARLR